MKQHEQALLFLKKAGEDEALLDAVVDEQRVADSIFGFHCQQAAEKLLKAWLSQSGTRIQKTHDLRELMNLLEAAGHKIPPALSRIDELTPFAVEFRYDTVSFDERFDRRAARELVRRLRAFVEKQVNPPNA
jgi:HEPN domain-containing protein